MYSSIEDVKRYTGVTYDKLGLSSEEELNSIIETYLKQVKSLIDQNRGRDLEYDLSFGERRLIVPAESEWSNAEKIYTKDFFPKSSSNLCINRCKTAKKIIDFDFTNSKTIGIYIKGTSAGTVNMNLYKDPSGTELEQGIKIWIGTEWLNSMFYAQGITKVKCIKLESDIEFYFGDVYSLQIPEGIHNIAMRATANMIKLAYANRESPVVTIEDLNAKLITDEILTPELRRELRNYPRKTTFGLGRI